MTKVVVRLVSTIAASILWILAAPAHSLIISFDYRYDTEGFFAQQARKDLLKKAAESFSQFEDTLARIAPSGDNTWEAEFDNPSTGEAVSLDNLTIEKDTVLVFVGARALVGARGEGGPGGTTWKGATSWGAVVDHRGQSADDFGPWGGEIAFDKDAKWSFKPDGGPAADEYDFLTFAMHELAHVLGFGFADSWIKDVNKTKRLFGGTYAKAVFEDEVPLADDLSHWKAGTQSAGRTALMVPETQTGTRLSPTALDVAGLCDVGWDTATCRQVIPAPSTLWLTGLGILLVLWAGSRTPRVGI